MKKAKEQIHTARLMLMEMCAAMCTNLPSGAIIAGLVESLAAILKVNAVESGRTDEELLELAVSHLREEISTIPSPASFLTDDDE
jgi:hypothetical protein